MKYRHRLHIARGVLVLTAAALVALFACEKTFDSRHPSDPQEAAQGEEFSLKIMPGGSFDGQVKATTLSVSIEKNMQIKTGSPADWQFYMGYTYPDDPATELQFPFVIRNVRLPYPPYEYRIKATAFLSRGATVESAWQRLKIEDGEVYFGDIGEPASRLEFLLETYETLEITGVPLWVEQYGQTVTSVDPDEPVTVRCGNLEPGLLDAPDSDRFPVSITLWEEGERGMSLASEPFTAVENAVVEGTFPDPYGNNLFEHAERVFWCSISDSHGTSHRFSVRIIRDLPEPIEVSLDCNATNALVVERNAVGASVDVFVKGENAKDLTITIPAGADHNNDTQGESGDKYSISGFEPEVDPQTGRPYIRASGSDTWCPVVGATPIAIVVDCNALWDFTVRTADGTNLGQDTTADIWENGILCVPITIPNGSSGFPNNPSCCAVTGNILTIDSISVGTDASGRPITGVGNSCTCP